MSVDFKEYKAAFLEQNDLAHFGILGMKWGVRRYQNPDGTLTPAGKKRYDRLNDVANQMDLYYSGRKSAAEKADRLRKKAKKYGTETPEEYKERKDREWNEKMKTRSEDKQFFKDNQKDIFTEHDVRNDPKRAKAAADLGLEALNKIGRQGYDPEEGITNADRKWFIYEDQTIGLMTLADLALHGKSKDQINKMIKGAKAISSDDYDAYTGEKGVFQLSETWETDKYLDALFAILNAEGRLK